MPVVSVYEIDTTPGSLVSYHFAPEMGWSGTAEEYVELIRSRYLSGGHLGMLMLSTARGLLRGYEIIITGPYADAAREIINKLAFRMTGVNNKKEAGFA